MGWDACQWSTTLIRLPNQSTWKNSMLEDFVYSKEQDDFSPSKQLSPDLTINQLISFKRRYKIDISHLNAGTLKNILGLIFQHLPLWEKIENTLRLIIRHSSESCQFKRLRHTLNVFFGAGKYIFFCIWKRIGVKMLSIFWSVFLQKLNTSLPWTQSVSLTSPVCQFH